MLVSMCAGYFLVLLDVTIVNVAVPKIGTALHASVSELQWVVDGYALALASLMLAAGTLGDRHGHKRIVLAGLALFGAASAACGAAPSAGMLVVARAAQGVGASLMLPGTLAVITDAYPDPRRRARAIGTWAAIGSIALPAGPLLGGALIDALGWRAIFFLNLPVCAVAFAGAARTVTERRDRTPTPLDPAGLLLGVVTLAALTFALIARQPVAGGLALVSGAVFVAVERTRARPMLPLGLFRHRDFTISNAVAATMNLVSLGLLFVVTLYLQDVRHRSALSAGLELVPLFGPLSLIAPFSGRLTAGHGSRRPMIGGLLVAAAGLVLLAHTVSVPALLLWGTGLGFLTPAVVARAVSSVPRGREGLASAVNNAARQTGGVIGIAAFGALAGDPGAASFVTGLHTAALIGAGLFVAAAVASGA
jgi:DHA2 family methylenomycin A resistance protein-like MFS transporter